MRTRIAQGAVRTSDASEHESTEKSTDQPRLWRGSRLLTTMFVGGVALIAASVIAAATLGTAAGAIHRQAHHHHLARAEADAQALAVRERVAIGMRWLTAWKAAHPPARPAPPPPPAPPAPVLTDSTSTTTPDWACIRVHESGDRFNTPAAPGGAYGFLEETWLSLGYSGWPYEAAPAVQSRAALYLYNELGWQPWSTRFVCGL